MATTEDKIIGVAIGLQARFGREPTEQELLDFIMGDEETRTKIWNQEN